MADAADSSPEWKIWGQWKIWAGWAIRTQHNLNNCAAPQEGLVLTFMLAKEQLLPVPMM